MRLRNIPGAQDAILESPYVVQEPQTKKGHWGEVFAKKQPLHIEVGMGKGRFLNLIKISCSFSYISRACLKNALRKMCVQFPATNKLPYHTPNVNYIPDRYSQEISFTCLKNNNFFLSGKNLDGFF